MASFQLFGQVMAHGRGLGGEGGRYLHCLAPGILAQSALFTAIFYGIAAISERDLGVLHRYMVRPTPRGAIAIGKAMGSTICLLVQAAMVDLLCLGLGNGINRRPSCMLAVAVFIALGSALFSMFSLITAALLSTIAARFYPRLTE
jgi:ABC-2 type transport system permease protein